MTDVAAELRARAEKAREEPAGFWREVPCGHPPDPIAARIGPDYVCHCGWTLDPEDGVAIDEAPGPVVPCRKCGCHVACPPEPASTEPAPAVREDDEARVHREVLQQIAAMPTVQRNPDGDDQAAATMKLLAQEALDWPASAAPPILKGEDE